MRLTRTASPEAIYRLVRAIRGEAKDKDLHPVARYNAYAEAYNHVNKLLDVTLTPPMAAALISLRLDMDKDEFRYSPVRKIAEKDPLNLQIYDEFTKAGRKIGNPRLRAAERSLYFRGILAVE